MQQRKRPGAPRGNRNRVIPIEERKRGESAIMHMPYEEWEMFKASADLAEGHSLSEEEYKDLWRGIDRLARQAFIKSWRISEDPAIIL